MDSCAGKRKLNDNGSNRNQQKRKFGLSTTSQEGKGSAAESSEGMLPGARFGGKGAEMYETVQAEISLWVGSNTIDRPIMYM